MAAVTGSALAATAGANLLSSYMQNRAAGRAASAQSAAAQAGIDEQRRQFDALQQLLQPYAGAGTQALQAQLALAGLGGGYYENAQGQRVRGPVGFGGTGGLLPAGGTNRVITPATPGIDPASITPESLGLRQQVSETGQASWVDAAGNDVDPAAAVAQAQAAAAQPQSIPVAGGTGTGMEGLTYVTPEMAQQRAIAGIEGGAQFQSLLRQGEGAILSNASATGGLRGGNTQSALAQFRPQLLSQLIEQQYARLGGISSLGQNAAAGVGNAGMQTGGNIANLLAQQGAAQAGGALGQANAFGNALGGVSQAWMLSRMLGGGSTTAPNGGLSGPSNADLWRQINGTV